MEYKDYYKILGVEKKATEKEIKSAYRKLARQYHPDVNPNNPQAEARFKEVNEAYEVLGDSAKRAKYDQLGANWHRWQQMGGNPNNFDWSQWMGSAGPGGQRVHVRYGEDLGDMFGGDNSPFSDFFSNIFGGMSGGRSRRPNGFEYQSRPQMAQDVEQEVEISLAEAYHGASRLLNKDGRRLQVKIPAGAKSGTKVRMRGEGQASFGGGQTGDLYLKVKVANDPRFERKGDNLYTTIPVDLYTAVLGGEVRVPTFSGDVNLKIPSGSQNGQSFRLKGKGMPKLKKANEYGDLYARLDVRLPAKLNDEQRQLFEKLKKMGG